MGTFFLSNPIQSRTHFLVQLNLQTQWNSLCCVPPSRLSTCKGVRVCVWVRACVSVRASAHPCMSCCFCNWSHNSASYSAAASHVNQWLIISEQSTRTHAYARAHTHTHRGLYKLKIQDHCCCFNELNVHILCLFICSLVFMFSPSCGVMCSGSRLFRSS